MKTERGTLWRQKNFRKKIAQCRKKIQRVDPLGTSGCVCFLEKGTLWIKFASLPGPDLALVGFRTGSKKWTDQCEACSLKKNKTGTSKVGAISKAQKAQNIFLEKNLEFWKKNRKMSHSAKKCERRDPF